MWRNGGHAVKGPRQVAVGQAAYARMSGRLGALAAHALQQQQAAASSGVLHMACHQAAHPSIAAP
jgi:hypothetical protein